MFLMDELKCLEDLNRDSKPIWGEMSAIHMLEHVIDAVRISNAKITVSGFTDSKKLAVFKKVLMSNRPLPKNFTNPNVSYEYKAEFGNITEAVDILKSEVEDFYLYFENNPDERLTNPSFGDLNKSMLHNFNINIKFLTFYTLS